MQEERRAKLIEIEENIGVILRRENLGVIVLPYHKTCHKTCHTPTTDSKNSSEDWEKEFDERFQSFIHENTKTLAAATTISVYVKDFIRSQIQQAEARGRKETIEYAISSNNPRELLKNYALYHGIKLEATQTPEHD